MSHVQTYATAMPCCTAASRHRVHPNTLVAPQEVTDNKKLCGVFNYSSWSCSWSWYVTVKKPCWFLQSHGFYQIQIFTLHSTPGNRETRAWRMEKPRSLLIWYFVCLRGIVHHKFPLTCTASILTDVMAKQKENKLKSEGNREIMKRKRPWMRQYNVSKCSINASVMGC